MKKHLCILILITGCSNHPTSNKGFDESQFTEVATSTMLNFNRTRPVDYSAKQPFKDLEGLCADYSFSPEEQKKRMMNILAQANYDDPMYSEGSLGDTVRLRQSHRNADIAYQMCMNAYRDKHGMTFVPINMRNNEFYDASSWNK